MSISAVPPATALCSRRVPQGSSRSAASPLDPGFLPERTHGLSHRAGAFSQREGHPGASSGVEADEEVAVIAYAPVTRGFVLT
jgi:hypothetical protein